MADDTLAIVCLILIIISCLFCCGDFYAAIRGPSSKSSQTCCSVIGFIALVIWTLSACTMSIYAHYRHNNDICDFDPNEKCIQTHSKGSYTHYGKRCSSECRGLVWSYIIGYIASALGFIVIIITIIGLTVYGNSFSEDNVITMLKDFEFDENKRESESNHRHKKRSKSQRRRDRKQKRRRRYEDEDEEEEIEYNTVTIYGKQQETMQNIKQLEIMMKAKPKKPEAKPKDPTPPLPVVDELEQKRAFDAHKAKIVNGVIIVTFVDTDDSNKIQLFPETTVDIIISFINFHKNQRLRFFGVGFNKFCSMGAIKMGQRMRGDALKVMRELEYDLLSDKYVVDFYIGSSYTILESNAGYLYGVGFNSSGQLGFKSPQTRRAHAKSPKRIAYFDKIHVKDVFVNTTAKATFFADYTLKIYGCGYNKKGNLGLGINSEFIPYPQHIAFFDNIHIIDMQNDQYGSVALDTRGNIYISASKWMKTVPFAHRIRRARKRREEIDIKLPKIIEICVGGQIQFPHFLDIEGTVYRGCFSGFDLTPVPYYKENGIKIVRLMGGQSYSIALCEEGNIYQWNDLLDGKVRNQPFTDPVRNEFFVDKHVVDVKCGKDHCCVICMNDDDEKEYYVFGRNSHNCITPDTAPVTEPMLYDFKGKCGIDDDDVFEVHLGSCTTMVVVKEP